MFLPEYVRQCMARLEENGYPCYAVGGCVRDDCLGLTPHDYDLCTSATPEVMETLFSHKQLVLAGEKHGTVGVVTDFGVVEITTFRTEGSYADSRHPDYVNFVRDVNEDLARRDFTVNAMAYSPSRGFADPFGGREDLKNGILRAVGDPTTRFTEDALRILRGVRFSVRFGLTPDKDTMDAMIALAPRMEKLAAERVFDELCKLLPLVTAEDLLRYAPILTTVIPELAPTMGFDQRSPHHAYDVFTHTAYVVEAAPTSLSLRWAALLHDIGKVAAFSLDENGGGHFYDHAPLSAQMADAILRRLKAPNALRERVVFLIDKHMIPTEPDKKLLRRRLSRFGEDALQELLALQKADFCSKGVSGNDPQFEEIHRLLEEILQEDGCLQIKDLAIDGHDLMALGIRGKAIGDTLDRLLSLVLEETVPNEKAALISAISKEETP